MEGVGSVDEAVRMECRQSVEENSALGYVVLLTCCRQGWARLTGAGELAAVGAAHPGPGVGLDSGWRMVTRPGDIPANTSHLVSLPNGSN